MSERPLYPASRDHLCTLGGPLGIWQHAAGTNADETFGYCSDDVARALLVDLLHRRQLGWNTVAGNARRSLRFLSDAYNPATGSFRNFRGRDGVWLEAVGSPDSQGRVVLALGTVVADAPSDDCVADARSLLLGALPAVAELKDLRATASVLLGCGRALDAGVGGGGLERTFEVLATRLADAFAPVERDGDWPWPEPFVTYENPLLPQALIAAGARTGDARLRGIGLTVLDWLDRAQTTASGTFSAVGSDGWWRKGGVRSRFDQQPIEATAMILAAEAAFGETGNTRYVRAAEAAYGWFLGDNDMAVPVADPARGGCHDGLTPRGVNLNEGAESTLMWLTALEHIRAMRTGAPSTLAALSDHSGRELLPAGAIG